ncbi:MAG: DNA methyltransferase [Candidatus Thermoplasmatota archaeon]|jgi:tRNA (guanine10-N2)-dimethyltransferase|nr:DNA methyltransferase [Candidatus Thermoplasmatota archaeon]
MLILFELSKEHKTLPKNEILACLNAENICYSIVDSNDDVLVIKTDASEPKIKQIGHRLSLTFNINELFFSCSHDLDDIKNYSKKRPIKKEGSIAIKHKNRSKNIDSKPILDVIEDVYTKNKRVDLTNPDMTIRALITDTAVYVGLLISTVDRSQFEKRKVQFRPFFSPISLHPKIARALVNLSCAKKNETLLDPFCGTGGILLEAGLIGIKVIGSDIEKKMVDGCKKTLDFYKIEDYELFCIDIGDIKKHIKAVDAVVTDMPYGKSTTTRGEDINQLYERAFKNISGVLKKDGKAVIGLSNEDMIYVGEKYFSLVEKHDFRVHRSLTRYFAVYRK